MKVLLVQPPIEDFYDTSIRTYPLGLLYIAAAVGEIADVAVLDARTGRKPVTVANDFKELGPFYRENVFTPFSFFSRYSRFGLPRASIKAAIEKERPDIVAVSAMCSAFERQAIEVAEAAKEAGREIVTVVGGVHATLFPERVLASPAVDYCVRGEGETSFFSLVTALASGLDPGTKGIDGLCFKGSGPPHISFPAVEADIDRLPGRRYIEADRYRIGRKNYAFFLTSRGCPNACSFCGKPPAPYRRRGLRAIEEEIDECARLGIEAVDFEDDMLNLDRRLFHEVLGLFSGRQMTLSAMNGVYPSRMDAPTLEAMHRAGFRRLNFSLVDLSLPVVAAQARASHDSFVRLLPWLDASSFLVEVHFIIGLPSQSPADLLETLCFLMGHRVLLGPSIFYLAPGSPMAASAAEIDIPLRYMRSSVMLPVNPLFPRQVTYTFVKLVRFINYVKTILDAPDAPLRASDLPAAAAGDERKRTIVERLLTEKRFVCYDAASRTFHDEPVDAGLVAAFFQKAKGAIIMGFKSGKSLLMDV